MCVTLLKMLNKAPAQHCIFPLFPCAYSSKYNVCYKPEAWTPLDDFFFPLEENSEINLGVQEIWGVLFAAFFFFNLYSQQVK